MGRLTAGMERVREKRKSRREKSRREKSRRKKIQVREKGRKVAKHCVFPMICGSGGRKVGSLKRRVRSQLARWEMKNCTPLWREAHFQVKMYKTHQVQTTFGSWDVEKVHAVVARSTFRSQNVQNTSVSDRFWKLRCRKSVRRCGAKHISKSKCTKHLSVGPLLEVQVSFRVTGARDCAPCQKSAKREGFCSIFNLQPPLHHITLQYTTLQLQSSLQSSLHSAAHARLHSTTLLYTTLHYTQLHWMTLHYTTLHHTTLHYTTFHYTTLHYTTFHYITLHYLPLHYTPLHYITLHLITLHYATLHYTTLRYTTRPTTIHYTTLHHTTLHYTALHYTTPHYTTRPTTLHYTAHYTPLRYTNYITLHSTPLHYITLHCTTLHYTTLHYTNYNYNYHYNSTTFTLRYTTLH